MAMQRLPALLGRGRQWLATAALLAAPIAVTAAEPAKAPAIGKHASGFARRLIQVIADDDKNNVFISPLSIEVALAFLHAGADGDTARQIAKAGGFDAQGDEAATNLAEVSNAILAAGADDEGKRLYQISIANGLWPQRGYAFLPSFMKIARNPFDAEVEELDYLNPEPARERINAWVAERTKDKIKDLFPAGSINDTTRLVLANAIYFRGDWKRPFKSQATKEGVFFLDPMTKVDVPLMRQTARMDYAEDEGYQYLRMAYVGDRLTMALALPRDNRPLTAEATAAVIDRLAASPPAWRNVDVDVTIPRFKFEAAYGLNDPLKALGMVDAFSPIKANFSRMTSGNELCVGVVRHQAFVAVDEQGTEAAAATGATMVLKSAMVPKKPATFRADHPFAFVIVDEPTRMPVFVGRVSDPSQ